jgi:hypothetical protein
MTFNRIGTFSLLFCLAIKPVLGSEFVSQALANPGAFYHSNGAKTKTLKLGTLESGKVRGLSNGNGPAVKPIDHPWMSPEIILAALAELGEEATHGNIMKNYSGLPGMFRFAQRLKAVIERTLHHEVAHIGLTDLYNVVGSPEGIDGWTNALNLERENPGQDPAKRANIRWQRLPGTYNLFELAAKELNRNPFLYIEGVKSFTGYLVSDLGLKLGDAKKVTSVLFGRSRMGVLSVLLSTSFRHELKFMKPPHPLWMYLRYAA